MYPFGTKASAVITFQRLSLLLLLLLPKACVPGICSMSNLSNTPWYGFCGCSAIPVLLSVHGWWEALDFGGSGGCDVRMTTW